MNCRQMLISSIKPLVLLSFLACEVSATTVDFTSGAYRTFDDTLGTLVNGDTSTVSGTKFGSSGLYMAAEPGRGAFTANDLSVGSYYGDGSGVAHVHWRLGQDNREVSRFIVKSASGGAVFDLNYFVLSSNTDNGGGAADNTEDTYIVASKNGSTESFRQKLPSVNWGGRVPVYLGPEFNEVRTVWFESTNAFCFGVDDLTVSAAPPGNAANNAVLLGSGSIANAISDTIFVDPAGLGDSSGVRAYWPASPVPALPPLALLILSAIAGMLGIALIKRRSAS